MICTRAPHPKGYSWRERETEGKGKLEAFVKDCVTDSERTVSASERRQGSLPWVPACRAVTRTGFSCLATFFEMSKNFSFCVGQSVLFFFCPLPPPQVEPALSRGAQARAASGTRGPRLAMGGHGDPSAGRARPPRAARGLPHVH